MDEKSSPPSYFQDLKVMVIDDHEYMRTVLGSILLGFKISRVKDYPDAVAAYAALGKFEPNLILTDWEMKPVDGLQLIRRIRTGTDSPDRFVPIVMVTGHSHVDKVMQARNAGANDFLIKPVSANSLYLRIRSTMEHPRPFVRSETYFGPDRRRREIGAPAGTAERRVAKATVVVAA
jgi:PleD family two-component response regulator